MSENTPESSVDSQELSQAIDRIETQLDTINRTQKTGRLVVLGGSILLIVMMAAFGLRLFKKIQTQINEQTLQAALTAKGEELWPQLSEKLTKAAMSAVPAYREEATKRLQALQPKLQAMVSKEAQAMTDRLPVMLQEKAAESLERVTKKVASDIQGEVPGITPDKVQEMSNTLIEGIALEADKLQAMLAKVSEKETARIEKILRKLPVDEAAKESEERLQQRFMHHILMIVDRAVAPDESVLRSDATLVLDANAGSPN
jgi:hypothetical protein